jgi:ATP-dependent DNA ligase I
MKLDEIVRTSKALAGTRSRLEKMELLGNVLHRAAEDEVAFVVSSLAGRLPRGRVGVGHATLGDMRRVPAVSEPELDLREVDAVFEELERVVGARSTAARNQILRELFRRATPDEQDFLARLLLEDLRQGSLEGVMLEAIARATSTPSELVRRAFMLSGDLGLVARTALVEGSSGLSHFGIEMFRPVRPMLAQTADDVADALAVHGTAALEYKLDGARIQVHKSGAEVRIFSRQSNDVTGACPEIVERIGALPVSRLVLDGEAIAFDRRGRPQPFQTTMRRFGRKLDVGAMRSALPLTALYFDCLLVGEESILDRGERDRLAAMREVLDEALWVPRIVTSDLEDARSFVAAALAAGHEGVMVKSLDAPYEAGSRGKAWLKVKSVHTLDLVVLAAEWGSGRRRGWLSNIHLGARDPETGGFVMLGKTFKGMTDEVLEWQTKRLQEIEIGRDQWTVTVRPEIVVEVAFNDVQKSSHYPGGLALRFARLKSYREDKRSDEADTIATVREIYRKQTGASPEPNEKQLRLL